MRSIPITKSNDESISIKLRDFTIKVGVYLCLFFVYDKMKFIEHIFINIGWIGCFRLAFSKFKLVRLCYQHFTLSCVATVIENGRRLINCKWSENAFMSLSFSATAIGILSLFAVLSLTRERITELIKYSPCE